MLVEALQLRRVSTHHTKRKDGTGTKGNTIAPADTKRCSNSHDDMDTSSEVDVQGFLGDGITGGTADDIAYVWNEVSHTRAPNEGEGKKRFHSHIVSRNLHPAVRPDRETTTKAVKTVFNLMQPLCG